MPDDQPPRRRGGTGGESGSDEELSQDAFVERLRPDPSQPPQSTVSLAGLLGDSDRQGFRRLYFTRSLDHYAEFRAEDVVYSEPIPPEQGPLVGTEATRVGIRRGAPIEYTRTGAAEGDEFDIDVRLGAPGMGSGPALPPETWEAECPGPTWGGCDQTLVTCGCETVQITICRGHTCADVCTDTCRTECGQRTCETCRTQCGQATCQATCQTCQTRCGQATCQTCQTQCGQATCHTCQTRCGQATCGRTCVTCDTCNPHVFTCGNQCL